MGKKIEIYVNDNLMDLPPKGFKFSATYSINDINSLNVRSGDVTKTFKLAGTHRNRSVFGFSEDFSSTSGIDQTIKPDARIEIDGTTVIDGVLKVTNVVIQGEDNKPTYECVIVGNNAAWKTLIIEKSLKDLDMSDQDHIWEQASIDASETLDDTRDYVYPLINYGDFSNGNLVQISDRFPAIRIKRIVEQIFNDVGYRVSSSFFDSDFGKRLFMPFTQKRIAAAPGFADDKIFRVRGELGQSYDVGLNYNRTAINTLDSTSFPFGFPGKVLFVLNGLSGFIVGDTITGSGFTNPALNTSYTVLFSAGTQIIVDVNWNNAYTADIGTLTRIAASNPSQIVEFDNESFNGAFDTNNVFQLSTETYTPQANARQNIICSVDINTNGGDWEFGIYRIVGTTEILVNKIEFRQDNPGFDEIPTETITVETGFLDVQLGDLFKARISIVPGSTNHDGGGAVLGNTSNHIMYNVVDEVVAPGGLMQISEILPETTQVQFIQDLKDLFNLYFDTDVGSRTVTIESFNDFYVDEIVDWTDKLDTSKDRKITFIGSKIGKKIIYKYADDSNDANVEQITERNGVFEEHEQLNTNQFAKDTDEELESGFAPTYMAASSFLNLHETLIPTMWKEIPDDSVSLPERSTDYVTRILYYDGVQPVVGNDFWSWIDRSGRRTDFPRMVFYDEDNDNDFSLLFRTIRRSHGLYEKYWINSQKLLNEGRVFKAYFKLDDVDIANLDFRKKIKLTLNGETHIFILNKVSNYNGESSTLVELVTTVGSQQISRLTTLDDDDRIIPKKNEPILDPRECFLQTIVNGVIVDVYSLTRGGVVYKVKQ